MKFRTLCFLLLFYPFGLRFAVPKEKINMVHQEADRLEYDDKLKIMHLSGHVKLWQGKTFLQCDHATYNLKTQEADADGDLQMKNEDGTVSGDRLKIFYKQETATVDGQVALVYLPSKKKEKERIVTDAPITLTADQAQYDWKGKTAVAEGNVVLEQKGRKAWGNHAVFLEGPQQLTMDGNVKLFRPPKDTLLCDHLVYELETDHAVAEGHVVGNFLVKEKGKAQNPPEQKPKHS